jgi:thioredoxin reductase (NADPH)
LTTGLFGARRGLGTLVIEGQVPGGLVVNLDKIEDFPGFPEGVAGFELGPAAQEQAANAGAEFALAEVETIERDGEGWAVAAGGERYGARAVVVATGARLKTLGVPGEERLTGRGVSHCATCDGPLYRGGVVGVVGGGSAALHEALTLAGFAERVVVLADEITAQAVYRTRAAEEGKIELREGVSVEEVLGEGKVSGVRLRGGELVELAGLFVYVGLEPNTGLLAGLLELDDEGRASVDAGMRTELPGLLAVGAARRGAHGYALTAAADGAVAAIAAHKYITSGEWR